MAQVVTTDAYLSTIYKYWYTEKEFPMLVFRNSPSLRVIPKNRIGGLEYRFGTMYAQGGNVSGDYTVAVANAASASKNAEFSVPPGKCFCVFNIGQKEILAAQKGGLKGAYIKPLINRMAGATDALRKTMAACWFGFGAGDFGTLPAVVATGAASMSLNYDAIVKISIGTQFMVVNGTTPLAAFYDATVRTVSAIDGALVTWTGGVVGATPWAAGSLLELYGGRDATPLPNMPTGLAAWLPNLANRTGATWTTYIATTFYGVNRSLATNALAGWFYQRGSGEAKADALTQGIKLARRGGGIPDFIIVNDDDWQDIVYELNAQTNLMQQVNTAPKAGTNEVTRGIAKLKFAFSTSYLEFVVEDPYCPRGVAYILDKSVVEFAALSNAETPLSESGVSDNEPGHEKADAASEPDLTSKLIIDEYLSVTNNSTSAEGPAAQVSLSIYGQFIVHEPGHCCVVVM